MNKFYLLGATALIALTAGATPALKPLENAKTKGSVAGQYELKPTNTSATDRMRVKSARKVSEDPGFAGDWVFQLGDWYTGSSSITVNYSATYDAETGEIYFNPPLNSESYLPYVAYYDAETEAVNFPKYHLFNDEGATYQYFVYQLPFLYIEEEENIAYADYIESTYYPATGVIVFEQNSGIAWTPCYDAEGNRPVVINNQRVYYGIYDMEGATKSGGGEVTGDWIDMGEALFADGWILPGVGVNQLEQRYYVPLQQDAMNSNRYRLVDPYKYGPLARYNESTETGYIIFDVTDPDHVVFEMADAGFSWRDLGLTTVYCYNQLGAVMVKYSLSFQEAVSMVEMEDFPFTTFKDGEVLLSYVMAYNDNGILYTAYDANFGYQGDPTGGQQWYNDATGKYANMTASILFPGAYDSVGTIGVDEEMAEEYFNLQGIRVRHPEKGQTVIVRKGNSTEKIIF